MTDTPTRTGGHGRTPRGLILLVVAALTLGACGDSTKRVLGLQRTAPDEFAVAPRAPLSQPPDFRLRPPRPGAEDLTTVSAREQARQAVFRGDDEERAARGNTGPATQPAPREGVARSTTGESAFLSRAGALETDPLIRSQIDRESSVLVEENQNFIRELLGLKQDPIDEEVDAASESRRLRENQALGVPPSEGETPTISRTRNGLFDIL
ncbi:MAG: DUF3035 domain-containing protein [Rhodospirillaceae bacterium]|nr:DUF3035 domain-containing protein [Rhodospirillaceae bacterium]MBT6405765.1 DUF3035 domain-containing protein [Rhodospirillaceae bacterium]MBT6534993.1 DUF3035 domain-containing protein [Rhodospirillaceae bacterium]MBT7361504.1 DUF3035 domain-containing protein [Rhodospirillaceae bacterium]